MSCTYYRWNNEGFFGDYWCDKKNSKVDSDIYSRYCRDYNYRECPIYKQSTSSSCCFITTVTCNILGLPDNHEVLNTLRNFRDNTLQKDKKYEEILKIYDAVGPIIANNLNNDENKVQIASDIYKETLLPIVNNIKNNETNRAIQHYLYMTLYLVSHYNQKDTYNNLKETNYGFKQFNQYLAGHGKRMEKKLIRKIY